MDAMKDDLHHQSLVTIGKGFPKEFVITLAEQATETLGSWFKANGIPPKVIELVDMVVMLERCSCTLEQGNTLNEWDSRWLTEGLPKITRLIVELGGVFQSGFSQSKKAE